MASGSPYRSSSSTRPRDARTASRKCPPQFSSGVVRGRSLEYGQPILDSGYAIGADDPAAFRPDQESPIDSAQERARGQTKPPLVRRLQNQPSRLVYGVPAREGASLQRQQAIDPPAPTTT